VGGILASNSSSAGSTQVVPEFEPQIDNFSTFDGAPYDTEPVALMASEHQNQRKLSCVIQNAFRSPYQKLATLSLVSTVISQSEIQDLRSVIQD
jgi:hypothetical protein